MSHQPERPREYVCNGCQNIVAGVVHGEPPEHTYEAPDECAACGASDFVELDKYPLFE